MPTTAEQWANSHTDLWQHDWQIGQVETQLANNESAQRNDEAVISAERKAAAETSQRTAGRPLYTQAQKHLAELRKQHEELVAEITALREARPQIVDRLTAACAAQQQMNDLAIEHATAAQEYTDSLKNALAKRTRCLRIGGQICRLHTAGTVLPDTMDVGSSEGHRVGREYVPSLVEQIEALVRHLESQSPQAIEQAGASREQRRLADDAAFAAKAGPFRKSLADAAVKFAKTPEVKSARAALTIVIDGWRRCPKDRTPAAATGTPEQPGYVWHEANCRQAYVQFMNVLANHAGVEFAGMLDFLPPLDLNSYDGTLDQAAAQPAAPKRRPVDAKPVNAE